MDENERAPRSVMDAGMYEIFYFIFLPAKYFFAILILCVKLQDGLI
jgi:hypothetical protein